MVSKRQLLARKRFKAEHPELFPKPEPKPSKNPKKQIRKKNARKKDESKDKQLRTKNNYKKHPLRVPGMRPGESCFICKGQDHIAKFCAEKSEWEKNKICLRCRRRGHRAMNCPDAQDVSKDVKYCYNCGESGHSLANCSLPLQEGGTKFAECFVCKEQGHLSKNCPKNAHGIYPKGGSCKICGGVTHLARDCPDKAKQGPGASYRAVSTYLRTDERPKGQVTKFVSGDDMEDDFMTDDINSGDNNNSSKSKDGNAKQKKGPKVVNF